jgi:peptidoglycan hydrolase-like protein with peptidoglycan-binding domain
VRLEIDSNYFSFGRHVPGRRLGCGVRLGFTDYRVLRRGAQGRQVHAARCLLGKQPAAGRARPSRAAVRRFMAPYDSRLARTVRNVQRRHPTLRPTGVVGPRTWVVLLSRGPRPVLKYGASGPAVRRVQRALNAVLVRGIRIDGVFGRPDIRATRSYQRRVGIRPSGVVNPATWRALQRGRVGRGR